MPDTLASCDRDHMVHNSRKPLRRATTKRLPDIDVCGGSEHVSAYNNVKVWEVPTPTVKPRPSHLRASPRHDSRPRNSEQNRERNEKLGVYARLVGVAILAAAMLYWPYARSCGLGLATYMASTIMVVVGGIWVTACTWITRMPRTHVIAMLVSLWGLGLLTFEVLPRIGYASAQETWMCS